MKKIIGLLVIVASLLFIYFIMRDNDNSIEKITSIIEDDKSSNFGVSLIANDKQIILEKVSGEKTGLGIKMNIDSQFLIGDLTNQFTAVSVLKLMNQKYEKIYSEPVDVIAEVKNALHTPISLYLGSDHPVWNGKMPSWAEKVTIHHLLSNTSGIRDFTKEDKYNQVHSGVHFYSQPHKEGELIDLVKNSELLYEPGNGYNFSRTNYLLLAVLVEYLYEGSFDDYLNKNIFKFLEMKHTRSSSEMNLAKLKNRSEYRELVEQFMYDPFENDYKAALNKNYTNLSNLKGFGTIVSNAKDLHKWNIALHKNRSLLNNDLYHLLISNYGPKDGYIYGYGIIPAQYDKDKMMFSHIGKVDGFSAFMRYFDELDTSVIILKNISWNEAIIEEKVKNLTNEMNRFSQDDCMNKNVISRDIARLIKSDDEFINFINKIDLAVINKD